MAGNKNNMADKDQILSRRRFLCLVGSGLLLALAAGAQAGRIPLQQAEGVSQEEVRAFSQEFAVLLDSGDHSLVSALETMAGRQSNGQFRAVLAQIQVGVEEGSTLSGQMAKFPAVFDAPYIACIEQGEVHGTLEDSIHQLARRG